MNSTNTNIARGYPIAILSALVLSTTAILVRILAANYQMPALVLAFWRDVLAALSLALFFAFFRPTLFRIKPGHLPYLVAYGVLLAAFNALWTHSVALNGAAISNVLVYCSTAFTALLGWWLLKERLTLVKILAVLLCLTGSAFVSNAVNPAVWSSNWAGITVGVLSGLGYAGYSLMGRSATQRGLDSWTTLLYTFSFASLFLAVINLVPLHLPGAATQPADFLWLQNQWSGWGVMLLLAAGPTVMGYGLYNLSMVYLPSSTANLIVTFEPAITVVTAYFLLGERMSLDQLGGGLMILAGVVAMRVFGERGKARADESQLPGAAEEQKIVRS